MSLQTFDPFVISVCPVRKDLAFSFETRPKEDAKKKPRKTKPRNVRVDQLVLLCARFICAFERFLASSTVFESQSNSQHRRVDFTRSTPSHSLYFLSLCLLLLSSPASSCSPRPPKGSPTSSPGPVFQSVSLR